MQNRYVSLALLLTLLVLSTGSISAQSPAERRANRLYENFAYVEALELFEHVHKKSPANISVLRRMADAAVKLNNHAKAAEYLQKLVDAGQAQNEDYLKLALAQESLGKKEEARQNFKKYDEKMAADKRGSRFINSLNNYSDLFSESSGYRLEKLGFNSSHSDFAPAFLSEGPQQYLLVVSNGFDESMARSKAPWNNKRWLDLWKIPLINDSMPGEPINLGKQINTKLHEGPAAASADGKTLAFTRNAFYKGKVKRSSDNVNRLNIYFASADNGKYSNVQPFEHNSIEYSSGHPAFSADGNTLYFVSDMPGGLGGTDIYKSVRNGNSWSKPENLGPNVNSEGNEMFPFVWKDSLLYFASNGWGGLGGLDVFKQSLDASGEYPINAGSPINSAGDDFGLIVRNDGRSGYFSSNRDGGLDHDDIYRFTYSPAPSYIKVMDRDEIKPIENARVEVLLDGKSIRTLRTNASGVSSLILQPCKKYTFKVKAEGYPENEEEIQINCDPKASRDVTLYSKKPKLYVRFFDRYVNKDLEGAVISLNDVTAGEKPIGLEQTDAKGGVKFLLEPCREYEVVAEAKGLPVTKKRFKSPCTNKDEDVFLNLATGIAPKKGTPVAITVTDQQTNSPVSEAVLSIENSKTNSKFEVVTDETGKYETVLKEGDVVNIAASRVGYFSTSQSKTTLTADGKISNKNLRLLKLTEGGVIALEGILYDLNKTDIRPEAKKVLDYVVQVMKENPSMIIELGSHTDSQGSDDDNLKLSEGRAIVAVSYLISQGIESERVSGKGYGETQILNRCKNGIKCPDKEHQVNRRTEIRVVQYR